MVNGNGSNINLKDNCIEYSSQKKKSKINKLNIYDKKLMQYQQELLEEQAEARCIFNKASILKQIRKIEQDREALIAEKVRGAQIRTRSNYHLHGEKNTRYFFNLENKAYKRKNRYKIINKEGKVITNIKEILKEQDDFYENLYKKSEWVNVDRFELFMNGLEGPKISAEEKEKFESPITMKEVQEAVFGLKKGKVCGSDGIPIEVYQFFFQELKGLILRICQEIAEKEMHTTARQGIITLIEKLGKDLDFLSNWRPLSLLNSDCKVYAKILAQRLETVSQQLIHTDQSGFLKNRLIHENLLDLLAIIDYTEIKSIPGLIVSFDFKKAFDTIDWRYIDKVLEWYNFGPKMRTMIYNAHQNAVSCTINCGHTSKYFGIEQGLRQGSPLSPVLFDLSIECLAMAIRQDKSIEGIKIGNNYKKHSQYADDLWASIKGSQESLDALIAKFDDFALVSGLQVNYDKTQVLRIGSLAKSDAKFYSQKPLQWSTTIRVLGIDISADKQYMHESNYEKLIQIMSKVLDPWKGRTLTIMGKILIINSLLASQTVYKFMVLNLPTDNVIKKMKQIITTFLWDGKKAKIAYDTLIKSKSQGGLALVDLKCKAEALKITWIHRAMNKESTWTHVADELLPFPFKQFVECNIHIKDLKQIEINTNCFLYSLLLAWTRYRYKEPICTQDVGAYI